MSGPLTLGTAGHVDHGKSTLVRALTGVDPDRLPEERARGLSIQLGYASLTLPGAGRMSIVDVPGHERFVRTMVSGASGVDMFLMVVAADDGVMPQTREHAAVLDALEVRHGVLAITKADLIDPALAMAEAQELFGELPTVAVAAARGEGLDELRAALDAVAGTLPGRADAGGEAVLHVDRVFTIRGAGTVVTGTLWSGAISAGDALTLLPAGETVRVRGVQVHDAAVASAQAGQRVAVNLAGVRIGRVARGDALVGEGSPVRASTVLDARLHLPGASHNQRIQVHHGTRDVPGRLADLGEGYWQLRLEEPLLAAAGDRVVVRSIAPPDTLGGGVVLDPAARRHGRAAAHRERLAESAATAASAEVVGAADPEPAAPAVAEPAPVRLGADEHALAERVRAAGFEAPARAELDGPGDLEALLAAGALVRMGRERVTHPEVVAAVVERVGALAARDDGATLAALRDELATSRRFAQAWLEHLDAIRVTRRLPDDRRIMRRAR